MSMMYDFPPYEGITVQGIGYMHVIHEFATGTGYGDDRGCCSATNRGTGAGDVFVGLGDGSGHGTGTGDARGEGLG